MGGAYCAPEAPRALSDWVILDLFRDRFAVQHRKRLDVFHSMEHPDLLSIRVDGSEIMEVTLTDILLEDIVEKVYIFL